MAIHKTKCLGNAIKDIYQSLKPHLFSIAHISHNRLWCTFCQREILAYYDPSWLFRRESTHFLAYFLQA